MGAVHHVLVEDPAVLRMIYDGILSFIISSYTLFYILHHSLLLLFSIIVYTLYVTIIILDVYLLYGLVTIIYGHVAIITFIWDLIILSPAILSRATWVSLSKY